MLSHLGPGWVAHRGIYTAKNRLGVLRRRLPARPWDAQPLAASLSDARLADPASYFDYRRRSAPPFLFRAADRSAYQPLFAAWDTETTPVMQLAEEIGEGKLRYFSGEPVQIGFPPDWHRDPFSGQRLPSDRHWTEISDAGVVDIKLIWEPSRFGFAYALVRAYWRGGDDRYAEWFWQALESWREANPPQLGANWHSGQEVALRVMAWCFALYGLLEAPATTPARVAMLAQMAAVSGERIAANLGYALSQQNNHGITEAAGLWTIGLLFPEMRQAERWKQQGRSVLEELSQTLIYEDGAFAQHSFNYQRLALQAYLWAIRLGESCGQPLSAALKTRVQTSAGLLYLLQDPGSGRLPNYGQNDGALILPLDNCDYPDFRPLLQVAHFLLAGQRRYADGPWDEALLWICGPEALAAARAAPAPVQADERPDTSADSGGYYTLRSSAGFAFVRCASFRHRPGQADMLHTDLWWRSQNIALDPGTYSYNAAPPWDNALARSSRHNTVTVDDLDQMRLASRFLWLPWLRGRSRGAWRSAQGHLAYWEGAHNGYERLSSAVWHRRGLLRLGEETWLVWDRLVSRGRHSYRLHWLLLDAPFNWDAPAQRLALATVRGGYHVALLSSAKDGVASLVRADLHSPRGWQAPRYHALAPALSLDLTVGAETADFLTVFSPEPLPITWNQQGGVIELAGEQLKARLSANPNLGGPLLAGVTLTSPFLDGLEVA